MISSAAAAPFLTGLTLAEPEPVDEEHRLDKTGRQGEWDPDEFPAWYRDRVVEADDDQESDNGAAEGQSDASSPADADAGYPVDLAAVRTIDRLEFGPITVLAGDNGSGKSTLVEAIAVGAGFNPEGGSRNLVFSTYDTHSHLHERLVFHWRSRPRWGWFLRAESFYGMASHIARDDDPYAGVAAIFPDLHNRSHGESFLELARSRFTGKGLYLLDEPESALSIQGLMALASIVQQSVTAGSQFIVSTHSPLLMALPEAAVYQLDADDGIERTTFDDLTSTALWRRFFNDPGSFHRMLAED